MQITMNVLYNQFAKHFIHITIDFLHYHNQELFGMGPIGLASEMAPG